MSTLRVVAMLPVLFLLAGGSALAQARLRAPYLDIVWNYYDGNYEQATGEIAAWPIDNLRERVFNDLDVEVIRAQGVASMTFMSEGQRLNAVKIWATLAPVAALMHIETGYHLFEKGEDKAGIGHLQVARLLADWKRWRFILDYNSTQDKELAYKRLRRDVYLAIAWILQSAVERAELQQHLELARKNLPDEAEIWLASGSAEELFAEPALLKQLKRTNTRVPRDSWELNEKDRFLAKAEEYHREAIARDPSLAEAHLRLGRVLQQRGKLSDARAELETARKSESPSEIGYLATLFLAGVVEEANSANSANSANRTSATGLASASASASAASSASTSAFDLYAELVERWPECQSGHLGLSRAYSARGDGRAALDALKPLWKEQERRACFDAWWVYRSGQAWRLKAMLQAFRERVVS